MQKAKSLRNALKTAFPQFVQTPDNLRMIITNRSVIPESNSLSYTIEYKLNILILNQIGDFAPIEATIINWANDYSYSNIATDEARKKFMASSIGFVDNETYHAEIEINLDEYIKITKAQDGTLSGDYLPQINFNDPFDGDGNLKNMDEPNIPIFTKLIVDLKNV